MEKGGGLGGGGGDCLLPPIPLCFFILLTCPLPSIPQCYIPMTLPTFLCLHAFLPVCAIHYVCYCIRDRTAAAMPATHVLLPQLPQLTTPHPLHALAQNMLPCSSIFVGHACACHHATMGCWHMLWALPACTFSCLLPVFWLCCVLLCQPYLPSAFYHLPPCCHSSAMPPS